MKGRESDAVVSNDGTRAVTMRHAPKRRNAKVRVGEVRGWVTVGPVTVTVPAGTVPPAVSGYVTMRPVVVSATSTTPDGAGFDWSFEEVMYG